MTREQHETNRSRDLEHRYRRAGIGALAFFQRCAEFRVAHQHALTSELGFTRVRHFRLAEVGYIRLRLPTQPVALVEAHQMRRAIDCLLYTSPSPRDGLLPRMP